VVAEPVLKCGEHGGDEHWIVLVVGPHASAGAPPNGSEGEGSVRAAEGQEGTSQDCEEGGHISG
jgi:hypothetical protein